MAKPIISTISPFDAGKGTTISFSWSGNKMSSNTLYIYNNSTNSLIYSNTVTSSYTLKNTVTGGYLTNGVKYYAIIIVTDYTGNTFTSDKVLFYCYTTPTFYFQNLQTTISATSYTADVYYYSPDGETFNFCNFYLYDYDTGTESEDSTLLYKSADISETNGVIAYTYRGLENHNQYWVRALGQTVHGMTVDTGYKKVYIDFTNEDSYAPIYAVNESDQGCIHVYTNLVIISSVADSDSYSYVDSEYIDLRDGEVTYTDIGPFDDFTMKIVGNTLWQDATILTCTNGDDSFELSSRIYTDGYLRFKLTCPISGTWQYIIYSDPLLFSDSDDITILLRRENNIFQIAIEDESYIVDEQDIWDAQDAAASS